MKAVMLLLAAAAFGAQANHEGHEGHGAHEHGHGQLNLVLDGNQLLIELQAPAADLVGFEHGARSETEKARYAEAIAHLKQPGTLLRLDPAAGCTLIQQALQAAKEEHENDKAHDEHPQDEAGHTDLGAIYSYSCETPAKLTGLEATLFGVYPSLEKLSVQAILPSGQLAGELTPSANTLSW